MNNIFKINFIFLFLILNSSLINAMPNTMKNEPVFPENSFYLGIDYHLLSLSTHNYDNNQNYSSQTQDLFAVGPCLYYIMSSKFHFSFTLYYNLNSSSVHFTNPYATSSTLIAKDTTLQLYSNFLVPTFMVKWNLTENCCTLHSCQEPIGFSLTTGFAYKTLLSQDSKDGFTLFNGSFPVVITGFSVNLFQMKNMQLFYNFKVEWPIQINNIQTTPINILFFDFSILYRIN